MRGEVHVRAVVADDDGDATAEEAQVSLDRFWATTGRRPAAPAGTLRRARRARRRAAARLADRRRARRRRGVDGAAAGALSGHGRGRPRSVDDHASVAFRGNRYSVPPGLGGVELTLRHRLGTATLEIVSPAGVVLVSHRLAPPGAGLMVRTPEHRAALEKVVLGQFSTGATV